MGLFSKILAGGLGWTLGGPIGAVIGVALASMFSSSNSRIEKSRQNTGTSTGEYRQAHAANDFQMALLVLIAATMKADGRVVKSELDSVKRVLLSNYGEQGALEALQILKRLLQQDIAVQPVAMQCAANLNYSVRYQLLYILYDIAAVDGEVNTSETQILVQIARYMQISGQDSASIAAMFTTKSNPNWAYEVLEIPASATDDEVKRAYREMVKKYHPDMLSDLGEDAKQSATEKFRKVKEAYDTIKKQRNMN